MSGSRSSQRGLRLDPWEESITAIALLAGVIGLLWSLVSAAPLTAWRRLGLAAYSMLLFYMYTGVFIGEVRRKILGRPVAWLLAVAAGAVLLTLS